MKKLILLLAFGAAAWSQCGANGSVILNPFTGKFDCTGKVGAAGATAVHTTTTFSSTPAYAVSTSTTQVFSLSTALTANISPTLTTTSATDGQTIEFILVQDGTGGRTVTWPANIAYACQPATAASAQTIVTTVWDAGSSTAFATGCAVNAIPVACSIEEFGPAANGTTDDSAVFTTAQTACPGGISLTPGKQYALKTSTTYTVPIIVFDPPAGGALLVSNSAAMVFNGTISGPIRQIFAISGGGTVTLGTATPVDYAEWFGAARDGSTDDLTAINNALTAMNGAGTTQLLAGTYKVTGTVVIPKSHQALLGDAFSKSIVSSTSTTLPIIAPTSDSAPICGGTGVSGQWIEIGRLTVKRNTGSIQAKGISVVNTCGVKVHDVEFTDNASGLYANGSAHMFVERNYVDYSITNSTTAYGFELDSDNGNQVNSDRFQLNVVTCGGTNKTGMYIHGTNIADPFVDDFETALCGKGVLVTSSSNGGTYAYYNGDIHLHRLILDQCVVKCVEVNGVYGTGSSYVEISNGSFMADGGSSVVIVDLIDTKHVIVSDSNIRGANCTSCIGFKTSGSNSSANGLRGGLINVTATGVQINSSNNWVDGTAFDALSGTPATTNVSVVSGSYNAVNNTHQSGYATTGILVGGSASNTTTCGSSIDPAHITTPTSGTFTDCGSGTTNNFGPVNAPAELWLMNEGTGTALANLAGHANTATAGGAITWGAVAGTCYNCATLGGTFDIIAANQTAFNPTRTTAQSYSFWGGSTANNTHQHMFLTQFDATGNTKGMGIWKNPTSPGSYPDQTIFYLQNNDATPKYLLIASGPGCTGTAGAHDHWTVTYDGSSTAAGVKIYKNGAACTTITDPASTDPLTGTTTPGAPVYLGGISNGPGARLIGTLSNVQMFTRALTTTEITALYAAGPMTTTWVTNNSGAFGGLTPVSGGVLSATSSTAPVYSSALTAGAMVVGGGAGAVPTVQAFTLSNSPFQRALECTTGTVSYTSLTANATTQEITIQSSQSGKFRYHHVNVIESSTQFAGTPTLTVSMGQAGVGTSTNNDLLSPFALKVAGGQNYGYDTPRPPIVGSGTSNIVLLFTGSAALGNGSTTNFTAGSVTYEICGWTMP